jgi:hypothetical protein
MPHPMSQTAFPHTASAGVARLCLSDLSLLVLRLPL